MARNVYDVLAERWGMSREKAKFRVYAAGFSLIEDPEERDSVLREFVKVLKEEKCPTPRDVKAD